MEHRANWPVLCFYESIAFLIPDLNFLEQFLESENTFYSTDIFVGFYRTSFARTGYHKLFKLLEDSVENLRIIKSLTDMRVNASRIVTFL